MILQNKILHTFAQHSRHPCVGTVQWDMFIMIDGSLESANWSILAPREVFKEVVGKNQDFMLIRLVNVNDLIGCGGDT